MVHMRWEVDTTRIDGWLATLDRATVLLVRAALEVLADSGPGLGRPLVDRIKGSKFHNMKELRPGSSGTSELRILFIFDPERSAITLVGGNKEGQWDAWYKAAITEADALYDAHLATIEEPLK